MRTIGPRHDRFGARCYWTSPWRCPRGMKADCHVSQRRDVTMNSSSTIKSRCRHKSKLCNIQHLRIRASDGFRVSQVLIQKPSSQRFSQVQLGQQRVTSFVLWHQQHSQCWPCSCQTMKFVCWSGGSVFLPLLWSKGFGSGKNSWKLKGVEKGPFLIHLQLCSLLGSDEDEHLINWGVEPLLKSNLRSVGTVLVELVECGSLLAGSTALWYLIHEVLCSRRIASTSKENLFYHQILQIRNLL